MVAEKIDETTLQLLIDGSLYSPEVIHKCFYWYGGGYSADIKAEAGTYRVTLRHISPEEETEALIRKIRTDLIDFKTREIVAEQTKNIREMLIAKAFAHGDEFDETPPSNVNDPLGFEPSRI